MDNSDLTEPQTAALWVPEHADIEGLKKAAVDCQGCELWQGATQVVFSAGNPQAPLALVGEQPGDVEDRKGIPFVGPAGRLLQEALDEAGVPREDVYVTMQSHFASPKQESGGSCDASSQSHQGAPALVGSGADAGRPSLDRLSCRAVGTGQHVRVTKQR
jgi:hypothetical protein